MSNISYARNGVSPRKMPYRLPYLAVLLLTAVLAVPRLVEVIGASLQSGKPLLEANSLTDVVLTGLSAALLIGLLLAVLLPGKRIGYRISAIVLRLNNVFWLALLGVMGLVFVALVVIVCMGVLSVPMGMAALGVLLAVVGGMLLCALFAHYAACCLNETGASVNGGVWKSIRGEECPMLGMAIGMAVLYALIAAVEAVCASQLNAQVVELVDAVFSAIRADVPSDARTLVRKLHEGVLPYLNVEGKAAFFRMIEALRFLAVGWLYRDYIRMHGTVDGKA